MARTFVCRTEDVPCNGVRSFEVEGGRRVLIANSGGRYFACQAICPHQDVDLQEGLFDGSVLTCSQHLWQWNIETGDPMGIAEAALERYEVRQEEGSLYVIPSSALKLVELFAGISEDTFSKIARLARRREVVAGGTLYDVGDPAEDFFVLEAGRVEFMIGREDRVSPAGFVVRKGEVFGWAALLDGKSARRFAKAIALEHSVLLRINGSETLGILHADTGSGYVVMHRLSALIARYLGYSGAK